MEGKRLGALVACVLGLALMIGAAGAGAAGPARTLKFLDIHIRYTPVGFSATSSAVPPVGSTEVFTGLLENYDAQFGKPMGTHVGRIGLACTVLSSAPDGLCTGIAHVPDGFFTFVGNGPFTNSTVRHYAITGGVGAYARTRGEITIAIDSLGRSYAQVSLYS